MTYNNVTNTLRVWCDEMTMRYYARYERESAGIAGGSYSLSAQVTRGMSYKLGTLIDREYPTFADYRGAVLDLLSLHIDFITKKDFTKVESYYVGTAEKAFCEYLDSLSPDCPLPDVPYRRQILGEEAEQIAERFYEVWEYDTNYWFPLNGMTMEDKLFIAPKYLESYRAEIERALGLPEQRVYEYGESWYDVTHCAEVDAIEDYSGCEIAYCPKDFSWIMYFSHENTVAFAGTILPRIKEILQNERDHWNVFEWED